MSEQASGRLLVAHAIGAWLLGALAVALIALSVGHIDTTWSPYLTKKIFGWILSYPMLYRFIAAGVLAAIAVALAVKVARAYKALSRE